MKTILTNPEAYWLMCIIFFLTGAIMTLIVFSYLQEKDYQKIKRWRKRNKTLFLR
ncbi:hypothetical protein [Aquimarina sp. 2201CG5-10]|uniref:hypothetical protein n=1 Tax=Aquimarina callyspongiae TaxID=3098150 RepID=UPI002AB4ECF3|nr:hypothetical protein [Aquimarina sp. 2201CG5-10]MDY8137605.1 hypothetical protein [Aquimarina sp. 2201CG5-10]